MKTYWAECQDEIWPHKCQECGGTEDLYVYDCETWCRPCLEKTEIDDEPSLSNEERNE